MINLRGWLRRVWIPLFYFFAGIPLSAPAYTAVSASASLMQSGQQKFTLRPLITAETFGSTASPLTGQLFTPSPLRLWTVTAAGAEAGTDAAGVEGSADAMPWQPAMPAAAGAEPVAA